MDGIIRTMREIFFGADGVLDAPALSDESTVASDLDQALVGLKT
jgi:hypothetical protein